MKIPKLIHGIYFRVRHFISRLGPWDYGTVKNSKARKHKIFGMVEICVLRDYIFPYHLSYSDWQELPPFYWSEFKANINPNRVQKKYKAPRAWGNPPKKTNDSDG